MKVNFHSIIFYPHFLDILRRISVSLSELDCRHAKPRIKAYRLYDSEGLYLDVSPTGKRYWRQRYRAHGKEKILTIGSYPEPSLVKAREKRDAANKSLKKALIPHLLSNRKSVLQDTKQRKLLNLSQENGI